MSQKWRTTRPGGDEHAPFYAGYVAEAPAGDLVDALAKQPDEWRAALKPVSKEREGYRYAPGKWSIREVVAHINDSERVFSYRLLRFARGDATSLPGFDENVYSKSCEAESRTLADLLDELVAVRTATLALLRPMQDGQMERRGTASGKEITARALAWIIAGHARHHLGVLRERYLPQAAG